MPEKSRSVQPIPSSPSTFSAAQLAAMSSSSQSFASSLNFAGQQKPTVPFGNAANDIASLANSFNQYNQLLNVDGSSQVIFLLAFLFHFLSFSVIFSLRKLLNFVLLVIFVMLMVIFFIYIYILFIHGFFIYSYFFSMHF